MKIVATRGEIFSLKFTKYRLAAGLCPDPLGELKRSPRPPSRNKGPTSNGEGKGGQEKGGEGEGGEGEGGGRRGGEREGGTCSKVLGGIDAPAPAHTPTTSPPQRSGWKIFPFTPLVGMV